MKDYQILVSTTHERMEKGYTETMNLKYQEEHNNEECELPNGSYSISDIQDYFEYIIKKHETITDEPPVQVYVNKIQN